MGSFFGNKIKLCFSLWDLNFSFFKDLFVKTIVQLKTSVLWNVIPCILVEKFRSFNKKSSLDCNSRRLIRLFNGALNY
jgi:hypothetical protein